MKSQTPSRPGVSNRTSSARSAVEASVPPSPSRPGTTTASRGAVYPRWLRPVVREAARLEIPYEPVFLDTFLVGPMLLTALSRLGAEIHCDELRTAWHCGHPGAPVAYEVFPALRREDPAADIIDFTGAFRFELDRDDWMAARLLRPEGMRSSMITVLGGRSLADLLELEGRLREAEAELLKRKLHVYGSQLVFQEPPEVSEAELVLPRDVKDPLLSVVESFRREVEQPDPERPRSRGLLLMGRPGTGKTLSIGHILGRLEGCRRYLYVPAGVSDLESPGRKFQNLVYDISRHRRPAVVVVEDIDRLFQSGAVTPQYFLNVLDGMLRPGAPTLWIATCNDPSADDGPLRKQRIWIV